MRDGGVSHVQRGRRRRAERGTTGRTTGTKLPSGLRGGWRVGALDIEHEDETDQDDEDNACEVEGFERKKEPLHVR